MFEIRKSEWSRSCSCCNTANYESDLYKKVDTIYELKIGCMVNALCPDCLKALAKQIETEF